MARGLHLALLVALCATPARALAQGDAGVDDGGLPPSAALCPPDHVGCHTQDLDWMWRQAFFDDIELDTGWVPAGSPLQVRFAFFLGGSTEVSMGGTSVTSWPAPLTVQVPGRPGTGRFRVNYGMEIIARIRFDVTVAGIHYGWEGDIPIPGGIPRDLRLFAEAAFDPMLLPPSEPRPIWVSDETEMIEVLSVGLGSIIPVPGVDGGFQVALAGALDAGYQTDLVAVRDAMPIEMELGTTVVGPDEGFVGFGPAKDLFIHPEGTVFYDGSLVATPQFFIEVLGARFDIPIADIPIPLVDLESNAVFDDVQVHVPLPDVAVDPTSVDFGTVLVGDAAEDVIHVLNDGEAPLEVSVRAPSPPFEVGALTMVVPPMSEGSLAVRFRPEAGGPFAQMLFLATNDPDESLVLVRLSGEGEEPPPPPPPPPPPMEDAGPPPAPDAGPGGPVSRGGCGCRVADAPAPGAVGASLALFALALLARRRRRR